ncbi:MAG: Flp pilus assembly protein CpaB [Aliidongia sp.]|jgi:pilus assembly protein CpaB
MSLRSLLFGLIAVSAFVILGIFLQSLLAAKPTDKPVAIANQVLVAAANLPRGRLLRPEDVKWKSADELPAAAVAGALATQPGGGPIQVDAKALGDNVGAITRRDIAADEALLTNDVVKPGDRDFLPAVLAPGARAVTVSVSTLSGSSAGLIYPGDHVDLLLTQKFNEPNLPIGRRTVGEDIAQNLRVLAIDHYTQGGTVANNNEPQLRNSARTVTLEADPTVAVKIEVASDLGKLSLILRSLDTGIVPKIENPEVWAVDTSNALQQLSKYAPVTETPKPVPPPAPPRVVMVYRGDQATTNNVTDLTAPPTAVKN